jgi:N-acetylglucosamine repressor
MRLARTGAQVIGVVLDAAWCSVVSAGLDGTMDENTRVEFPTPPTYEALLERVAAEASRLIAREVVRTLSLGISTPGLINGRTGRAMFSPNLHITDGHALDHDLGIRLGIDCAMFQETQALCLGERMYGGSETLDDFVMLEISTGLGAGVMMGGRLMTGGASGLAGELGHVTVALDGPLCGCGNRGCLETLATDSALIREVSERLGQRVDMVEIQDLLKEKNPEVEQSLHSVSEYLAVAIAAAINLWNPATLFIHGRIFDVRDGLFDEVCKRARARALAPSMADCRILRARRSKRHGAIAGAIHRLFDEVCDGVILTPGLPQIDEASRISRERPPKNALEPDLEAKHEEIAG